MTEEEFWKSNPYKMQVYEKIYKEKMNTQNSLIFNMVGNYGISAFMFAIDHVLNGRKANTKYMSEPMQLFELTEEEKEQKAIEARKAFIAWAGYAETKYKKGGNE